MKIKFTIFKLGGACRTLADFDAGRYEARQMGSFTVETHDYDATVERFERRYYDTIYFLEY